MDYREKVEILAVREIDDGMGGFMESEIVIATIKCKVAPYTVKTVDSAGIPKTYSKNKLFTKDFNFIDDIYSDYKIKHKDVIYNKLNVMDVGKCLIIEMERV
ncbi:hypothetical protein TPELB_21160 [Terrisporobacter petrolearius]|uniref:Phage protein n=1 Tax=Terrisporobacter petrolearius TaxID=1460447 RepID=A0ABZ3FFQ3_9FIRM